MIGSGRRKFVVRKNWQKVVALNAKKMLEIDVLAKKNNKE
jgi:hypothetical protein